MTCLEHVRWLTESFLFNGIGEHGITGNLTLGIDFAKYNDRGVGEDGQCIDNTNNGNVTAGSFRPVEALAGLGGRDMSGDWTLLVGDAGYGIRCSISGRGWRWSVVGRWWGSRGWWR